jgi:adenine phosphoribosyltransferase
MSADPLASPRAFLASLVRSIPDHPKPGILFRDVTTVLKDPRGFRITIDLLVQRYLGARITKVVGIEARGFVFGAALAHQLGAGFVPARKPGKLPGPRFGVDYALEYGTDRLEMHDDAIDPADAVLVADDLIATGGTALAAIELVRRTGASVVEACFLVDLPELGGAKRVEASGVKTFSLIDFEGH